MWHSVFLSTAFPLSGFLLTSSQKSKNQAVQYTTYVLFNSKPALVYCTAYCAIVAVLLLMCNICCMTCAVLLLLCYICSAAVHVLSLMGLVHFGYIQMNP